MFSIFFFLAGAFLANLYFWYARNHKAIEVLEAVREEISSQANANRESGANTTMLRTRRSCFMQSARIVERHIDVLKCGE